jgi:microcystin-dependent protein
MTNATQFPINSREWARWLESRMATLERSVNPTATRIAQEVAAQIFWDNGGGSAGGGSEAPVGTISAFGGGGIPAGWFACNGQALSRETYADLFSVIGITYGAGDGTTTFNVPDLRGRSAFGVSGSGSFPARGTTGGSETHSHPLSSSGQALITMAVGGSPPVYMRRVSTAANWISTHSIPTAPSTASVSGATTAAELAGETDEASSLPPYLAVSFIICGVSSATPGIPAAVPATADTLVLRDAAGRSQITSPSVGADIANKTYTDAGDAAALAAANSYTDSQVSTAGTSVATPNTLIKRDGSARAQVADPSAPADIATKGYVDAAVSGGGSGTPLPTPSTVMSRDAAGRSQVVDPAVAADIATKGYADALGTDLATVSTIVRRDASGVAKFAQGSAANDVVIKSYADALAPGTSAPTVSTTMKRDAAGRAQVVDPSASADIATKNYVDGPTSAAAVSQASGFVFNNVVISDTAMMYRITMTSAGSGGEFTGITTSANRRLKPIIISSGYNSASPVTLFHEDSRSTATNRLFLPHGQPVVLQPGMTATLVYSSNDLRWILKSTGDSGTPAVVFGATVRRDSAGRAQIADPSAPADIANKGYIDQNAGDANATTDTLARRGASGVLNVGTPTIATHAATKAYVDTAVSGVTGGAPAGSIIAFGGSTAPAGGWLICDGASVTTAAYPALFAAIGYTYGGSGANFNLPNLKGRVPVGLDSAQTEFDALGETGGAKTHTLSVAEMPAHDHGGVSGSGSIQLTYSLVAAASNPVSNANTVRGNTSSPVTNTAAGSLHDHSIASQGGGGAHNNLQPYIVLNHIIKT